MINSTAKLDQPVHEAAFGDRRSVPTGPGVLAGVLTEVVCGVERTYAAPALLQDAKGSHSCCRS